MKLASIIYDDFTPYEEIFDELVVAKSHEDIASADAIVVWGGADISPELYGEGRSSMSSASSNGPSKRDKIEWEAMQVAKACGVPIIGVCRGAQMLCALAGGKLFQHVGNHAGPHHNVQTYDGKSFTVNSVHHQMMCVEGTEHELIAWTDNRGQVYWKEYPVQPPAVDVEMAWFPAVKGIAIQWHPEWLPKGCEANNYVLNFIKERIAENETTCVGQ